MTKKKPLISIAVVSTFITTVGVAFIASAENLFEIQPMEKGYMVADAQQYDDKNTKMGGGKCGEGKCGAAMVDVDKDGKITKDEWTKHHDAMFNHMDANKDGVIDKNELSKSKQRTMNNGHGSKDMQHDKKSGGGY